MRDYHFTSVGGSIYSPVTLLRFPMAVAILLLHSSFKHEIKNGISIFNGWDAPIYNHLDYVFVQNICNIAVPLFFLISGFLFFKEGELSSELYKGKIKRRIKTLLIPYLIWNIITCLVYLMVQNFASSMNSGRNKMITDYGISDFFMMFWSLSYVKEGALDGPIDGPLWFVRDLMVFMILTPILYKIIKSTNYLLPILSVLLYVFRIWEGAPGFSPIALAFFSTGAFFAIHKIDFINLSKDLFCWFLPIYLVTLIGLVVTKDYGVLPLWVHHLNIVIGVFVCIGCASILTDRNVHISNFLTGSVFFVFASHAEMLKAFVRLSSRLGIQSDIYYCIMYFICPTITLIILLTIYKLLLITIPRFASILSGGR